MSADDRRHWDARHRAAADLCWPTPKAPSGFGDAEAMFPASGAALEIACGRGEAAVWLALRGMEVEAYDVSPVAIDLAGELAREQGVADRCSFVVADLDKGVADGPLVDLVLCHLYSEPALDDAIVDRLAPGGLLAIATLSEVGAEPGPYRSTPGELGRRFAGLRILDHREAAGTARLLGRK